MKKFFVLFSVFFLFSLFSCSMNPESQYNVSFPPVDSDYKSIIIVSDLHLCDDRAIKGTYIPNQPKVSNIPYATLNQNRQKVVNFFSWVLDNQSWISEVVINGDFFDEWVVPMEIEVLSSGQTEEQFIKSIADANYDIIQSIKTVQNSGIKVTAVPGNHDMNVTQKDYDNIFGGAVKLIETYDQNQLVQDTKGLGIYYPNGFDKIDSSVSTISSFENNAGLIAIEHGHRYDFWNCPDFYSNRQTTTALIHDNKPVNDSLTDDTKTPIGFFVTRMYTSKNLERKANRERAISTDELVITEEDTILESRNRDRKHSIYKSCWTALKSAGILRTEEDIIHTNFDGFTNTYYNYNIVPTVKDRRTLYSMAEYESTWNNMKLINKVANPSDNSVSYNNGVTAIALKSKIDECAKSQFFDVNNSTQVVVFGHTHASKLKTYKDSKHVYANSGTWVDSSNTSTFIVISPYVHKGKNKLLIGNYDFSDNGKISKNVRSISAEILK